MVRVKICGITTLTDALTAVEAGADALGLNFWPASVRRVDEAVAHEIARVLRDRTLLVGVFVDAPYAEIERLRSEVGLGCVQLHGDEPPELLARFLPHAYKAVRVRGDVTAEVARFGGEHILLDAYVKGMPGGTGATFDWSLAG